MTLEENTPLGEKLARGSSNQADEEQQRAFFLLTAAYLEAWGYLHYEISNFARGESACPAQRQVLAAGALSRPGARAHSFDGRARRWNVPSVADYCRLLGEGRAPTAGEEYLTTEQRCLEALCLGLAPGRGWPWPT